MKALKSWTSDTFGEGSEARTVYRKGSGPGVVVLHEIPGMSELVVDFADRVVARGFTVALPVLFGTPGRGAWNAPGVALRFCVRREFAIFATGRTSPIAWWLRELARDLDRTTGGHGIGVVGMCFTGGFALAMMADAPILAPVLAEPSLPFPMGMPARKAERGRDLSLYADHLAIVEQRAAHGCEVLGLRYCSDRMVGDRFATLSDRLGDRFLAVEFEGKGHSVLTKDAQPVGVEAVLDFLDDKLTGAAGAGRWRDAVRVNPDGRRAAR